MKSKILVLLVIVMFSLTFLEAKAKSKYQSRKELKKMTSVMIEPGTLTITGLEKFNDMYIQASADRIGRNFIDAGYRESDRNIDMTADRVKMLVGATIKDGKAVLNVWEWRLISTEYDESWEQDANTYKRVRYTGNDLVEMHAEIWMDNETYHWHYGEAIGNIHARFQNGVAEAKFVETVYTEE